VNFLEFLILGVGSLFVIVDPVAAVPTFLMMTGNNTVQERIRMARVACTVTAVVLIFFAVAGKWVLSIFGITMPAFQVAGGFILLLVAYDMLRTQRSSLQETQEEKAEGKEKEDVAITPLAIPMLAGPGAISSVILLADKATNSIHRGALYLAVFLVCVTSYLVFAIGSRSTKLLSPIALKVTTRLMGLVLSAIAVQFIFLGISSYVRDLAK
jgi:multiple antibiotic resistance protein